MDLVHMPTSPANSLSLYCSLLLRATSEGVTGELLLDAGDQFVTVDIAARCEWVKNERSGFVVRLDRYSACAYDVTCTGFEGDESLRSAAFAYVESADDVLSAIESVWERAMKECA